MAVLYNFYDYNVELHFKSPRQKKSARELIDYNNYQVIYLFVLFAPTPTTPPPSLRFEDSHLLFLIGFFAWVSVLVLLLGFVFGSGSRVPTSTRRLQVSNAKVLRRKYFAYFDLLNKVVKSVWIIFNSFVDINCSHYKDVIIIACIFFLWIV